MHPHMAWCRPHHAMNTSLQTSFFDRFICKIFQSNCKVVSRHSQCVTILAHTKTSKNRCTSNNVSYDTCGDKDQYVSHDVAFNVVRFAPKIVLQSYIQQYVLATPKLHGLLVVEPRAMLLECHNTLTAHVIIFMPPGWPFDILVGIVFDHEARLPYHMSITKTAVLSNVIYAVYATDQKVFPTGAPKEYINRSDEHQLNRSLYTDHSSTVLYKRTEGR